MDTRETELNIKRLVLEYQEGDVDTFDQDIESVVVTDQEGSYLAIYIPLDTSDDYSRDHEPDPKGQ